VAVSSDGRFIHAYNAALTLCRIALLAAGYRDAKGGGAHYREINSLVYTLGESQNETYIFLSACAKKRGQEVYTHAGVVESRDVDDLIKTADLLRSDLLSWLLADHLDLYPQGYRS
jgi:hypothetical protein